MINDWIDDEWGGVAGAHADLLAAGLSVCCVLKRSPISPSGPDLMNCQAYIDSSPALASNSTIEVLSDAATVRLLKRTTDGSRVDPIPVAGAVLLFDNGEQLELVKRISSDEDSWMFIASRKR